MGKNIFKLYIWKIIIEYVKYKNRQEIHSIQ